METKTRGFRGVRKMNKLASLEATLVRNFDRPNVEKNWKGNRITMLEKLLATKSKSLGEK